MAASSHKFMDQIGSSILQAEIEVSALEYVTLSALKAGTFSQVQILRRLHGKGSTLSMSGVSRLLQVLEQKGMIRRVRDQHDDRIKLVSLTNNGIQRISVFESKFTPLIVSANASATIANKQPTRGSLRIKCPSCTGVLRIRETGKRFRNKCPKCGQTFQVLFEEGSCVLEIEEHVIRDHLDKVPAHELLGVGVNASKPEISSARRNLIKKYHPDLFQTLGHDFVRLATRHSQAINRAYEKLVS